MPNQSKASPPGIKETPSSSHHEFLMQEQPQQPRGSKVASTQTQDWPFDMVDQLTGAQDSPSNMVDQSTQTDLSELFKSGQDDTKLQLGMLGLRKRALPEEDLTGNPLAKRQKVEEGTQYRRNGPSSQEWSSTQTTDSSSRISLANLFENGSVSNVQDQESQATGGEDVGNG
ncbi:uncharacterized protein LOC120456002 [Drosophila santomea]|uniref:uncharacterized protein LOC120456002 n=1 Tax=Drosophila santomea TaxID=129105 RepID=UPI00195488D4|nr:uncharacterized protein LOC120456002 [Drosophila santomea]